MFVLKCLENREREREICCTESLDMMEIKWDRGVQWTKRQIGYTSLPLVQESVFLLKRIAAMEDFSHPICRVKESTMRIVCFRGEGAWNVCS